MIRWLCLIALLTLIAPATPLYAQDEDPASRPAEEETDDAAAEEEEEETADEEEEDRWMAITGGRVHTVTGPVLDDVTILCKNGRIEAIGQRVRIPDRAEVIDATGHEIYPGLVAVRSAGILAGSSPDDGSDVYSLQVTLARSAGITTIMSGNTAAKLTNEMSEMVVKRNVFESLNYTTRNPNGRRKLREAFDRLRNHLRDTRAHAEEKRRDPDAEAPDASWIKGEYERYMRLMKGEAKAMVDASSAHELLQLCDLAETYGISIVARGADEAWTVATDLARADLEVMIQPRRESVQNVRSNRTTGATIENAAILDRHGVTVSLIPVGGLFGPGHMISLGGLAGRDLMNLPMAGAFAMRGGLSSDAAVRALTLDAARIIGIDDAVGSIEVGKDADFAITDGDLLHYMTMTRWTVVNGRVVYDKAEDSLFEHIRPNGDRQAPPPDDHWPRRLGAEW